MGRTYPWAMMFGVWLCLLPSCRTATEGEGEGEGERDGERDGEGAEVEAPAAEPARALSVAKPAALASAMPTWDRGRRSVTGTRPEHGLAASTTLGADPVEPCPEHNCGSNSAVVNGSVLGAIPLGGPPNTNGFLIEPTLHPRDGSVAPALGLDVRDGQIVGVDGKGEVVAMGDELKGRWFRLIRRYAGMPEARGKIRIVGVAGVRLMTDRGPVGDPRRPEVVAGYELRYEPESGPAGTMDLCRKAPLLWPNEVVQLVGKTAAGIRKLPQTLVEKARAAARRKVTESLRRLRKLPREVLETVRNELPLDKPVTAILVLKDEDYNEIDATIRREPGTLTLACPGTAISKMKLMGYDPQEQAYPTTPAQRQAVIKMLTGRYCGAFPFTENGMPLYWENRGRWFSWRPAGTVEALWNEDGAICLNRPRYSIHTREKVSSYCKNLPPCGDSVSWDRIPEGAELISITAP